MNPIVTMKILNRGTIIMELFAEIAPNSVKSFIYMAQKGVYNNQKIRRIVKGFVLQPSYSDFENEEAKFLIEGEFECNGFTDGLTPCKGSVALGGNGKDKASGSCFFFVLEDNIERLYGKYPVIGKVTEGFEIIQDIENVETLSVDVGVEGVEVNEPLKEEIIVSVEVDTFGVVYGKPEIIKKNVSKNDK